MNRFEYITKAKALLSEVESINVSIVEEMKDPLGYSKRVTEPLEKMYLQAPSLLQVERCDFSFLCSIFKPTNKITAYESYSHFLKCTMSSSLEEYIKYLDVLDDFDEILKDMVDNDESDSYWYDGLDEYYFHIHIEYDGSISIMKIAGEHISKSSPQEFMMFFKTKQVTSVCDCLFYSNFKCAGISVPSSK